MDEIKEISVLAPVEEEEVEYYSEPNYDNDDMNIIGNKLNNNNEDNKINEDIRRNIVEEYNGDETTIDNVRPWS